MAEEKRLICFEWALKHMLRKEVNFPITEDFLTYLLGEKVKIEEMLESESNKRCRDDKQTRVDMRIKTKKGEQIIVEFQARRELDYLDRVLANSCMAVTENLKEGGRYMGIQKVISVSVIFCSVGGTGKDYIYSSQKSIRGRHHNDELTFTPIASQAHGGKKYAHEIHPEEHYIFVNRFDKKVRDAFDEWVYFFKTESVKGDFKSKGLKKAAEVLDTLKLTPKERKEYEAFQDQLSRDRSHANTEIDIAEYEGKLEHKAEERGMQKGIEKGIAQEQRAVVIRLHRTNTNKELMAKAADLTVDEIEKILADL